MRERLLGHRAPGRDGGLLLCTWTSQQDGQALLSPLCPCAGQAHSSSFPLRRRSHCVDAKTSKPSPQVPTTVPLSAVMMIPSSAPLVFLPTGASSTARRHEARRRAGQRQAGGPGPGRSVSERACVRVCAQVQCGPALPNHACPPAFPPCRPPFVLRQPFTWHIPAEPPPPSPSPFALSWRHQPQATGRRPGRCRARTGRGGTALAARRKAQSLRPWPWPAGGGRGQGPGASQQVARQKDGHVQGKEGGTYKAAAKV